MSDEMEKLHTTMHSYAQVGMVTWHEYTKRQQQKYGSKNMPKNKQRFNEDCNTFAAVKSVLQSLSTLPRGYSLRLKAQIAHLILSLRISEEKQSAANSAVDQYRVLKFFKVSNNHPLHTIAK